MQRRNFLKKIAVATSLPMLASNHVSTAAETSAKKNNATHKMLSCNVRRDFPQDKETGDSWRHRKELCADIIKAQKADVIGLQEAQEIHWKDLRSRMPDYDAYALSYATDYFHPINAILFLRERYEMISAGGFWLSKTPHVAASKSWDSMNPRLANWVHLKDRSSGKEFRFWNTHLDHKGQEARTKGAEIIHQASNALPKDFPQILVGDMNANIAHPAIIHLKESGWLDTYAAVNGSEDPGFTYHGFKGPKHVPITDGTVQRKVDWIFIRGGLNATSATIIRDGRNGKFPSDHYFHSAEVSIG